MTRRSSEHFWRHRPASQRHPRHGACTRTSRAGRLLQRRTRRGAFRCVVGPTLMLPHAAIQSMTRPTSSMACGRAAETLTRVRQDARRSLSTAPLSCSAGSAAAGCQRSNGKTERAVATGCRPRHRAGRAASSSSVRATGGAATRLVTGLRAWQTVHAVYGRVRRSGMSACVRAASVGSALNSGSACSVGRRTCIAC